MLINDTTFLLDESLDTLKNIRDAQEQIEDSVSWAKLSLVCKINVIVNAMKAMITLRTCVTINMEINDIYS